jgi:lysozyme
MITNLLDQLKRDEGFRAQPYKDSEGVLTIGYGTNLDEGIDRGEAEYLLANRANVKRMEVLRVLPWVAKLTEPRRAVLFNMAYNMGLGNSKKGLLSFKNTLRLIETGEYAEAAKAMLDSKWAEQTGQRALRLSVQLNTGEWQ